MNQAAACTRTDMNVSANAGTVTQAVVLVGGRGTRLGSLTAALPKPMLPIGGRPFVDYLLAFLAGQGVREVLLCVGYLAESFERHFAGRQPFGLSVEVHREPAPAGTGGALALARARLADTFYALNGDTIFTANLPELAALLQAEPDALGALALRHVEDAARFGAVRLAGDRIAGFMPNIAETVVAMLATSSIGAIWSSCSPDFGINGVLDRFGQITPRMLFCADGYLYNGKEIDSLARVRARGLGRGRPRARPARRLRAGGPRLLRVRAGEPHDRCVQSRRTRGLT